MYLSMLLQNLGMFLWCLFINESLDWLFYGKHVSWRYNTVLSLITTLVWEALLA